MDTKLVPTRLRLIAFVRWGLFLLFLSVWVALPPTGEPFKRLFRAITVSNPQCSISHRQAVGQVRYGEAGTQKVWYCATHFANPPSSITYGPLGLSHDVTTFVWGWVSFLLLIALGEANFFPRFSFKLHYGSQNDGEPVVTVSDKQTDQPVVTLHSPSPYRVEGDARVIAYLERSKPQKKGLPDYLFEKARGH